MSDAFRLDITGQNIGILSFDLPGEAVNKFSTPVMQEFERHIGDLEKNDRIKCLILRSPKKGIFIAGADINEIMAITDPEEGSKVSRLGQEIFDRFSRLPFPTVAVIDGACMGGGTELALACTFRIASDNEKTKIALPEVNLGIFPGWGGTQRLPRLIGVQRSLDIILSGKNLDAKKAFRAGVVDKVIPKEMVDEAALAFAADIIAGKDMLTRVRRKTKGLFNFLLEKNPFGRMLVYSQARKTLLKRTRGHYPAPLAALKVIRLGYKRSLKRGLGIESRYFGRSVVSPVSKNLIKIFFWTEAVKKENGTGKGDSQPLPVNRAATLGAGVMGGGIAQLFASRNIPVRVKDINYDAVAKAYQQASHVLSGKLKRRRITRLEFDHIIQNITGTIDYSGFKNIDFVVEAIVEDLGIKKKVFTEIEQFIRPDTIVVTNTSSLLVNDMAKAFKYPERFVGMHFFNPVDRMPLVEIIRGASTNEQSLTTAFQLAKKLGKTPIVVNDGPGFLVNRLLVPYMVEAISLLEEGYEIAHIDSVMVRFGMPIGPVELFDEVGLDVAYKVAKILAQSMGDRLAESNLLTRMIELDRLGKKNDRGFYEYSGKKKHIAPEVKNLIHIQKKDSPLSDEELVQRMLYPMVNEAARCLEEKIVSRPEKLDLAMIFGTGFAPFRGGLLGYADTEGIIKITEILNRFSTVYGVRFKPSEAMIRLSDTGRTFYTYFD
jgi:3-hydroxyacyl-CoA dehydrogenase/enoyl-CoA hydratase/3-hydroxybutyryl-CoA epimerase